MFCSMCVSPLFLANDLENVNMQSCETVLKVNKYRIEYL